MGKLASEYSGISTGEPLRTGDWWLKVPRLPALNIAVKATPDFSQRKPVDATAFYPEGETRAIVVTSANVTKGWEFPVTFRTVTTAAKAQLLRTLECGEVMLLQDVLPEQWYVKLVEEINRNRLHGAGTDELPVGDYYETTVNMVEVARPVDPPFNFESPPPPPDVEDPDPDQVPGPPTSLAVSQNDKGLSWYFNFPKDKNVTDFEFNLFPVPAAGQPAAAANAFGDSGLGGFSVSGLNNGQAYTILGRCKNDVGWGAWSGGFGPYTPHLPIVTSTRFNRDDAWLSFGTVGAWSPSLQIQQMNKFIRDDKVCTGVRYDYYRTGGFGGIDPNDNSLFSFMDRAIGCGVKRFLIICNGKGGWLNTSDGDFPTAGDESSFRTQWRTLAAAVRARYGPSILICYGCGNEVQHTLRDAGGYVPWPGAQNIPRFNLGKYSRAYSWMYPELKAGDPKCLVGPGSGIHFYTAIPVGSPGAATRTNTYNSPYKSDVPDVGYSSSDSSGHESWCNTDLIIDGCTGNTSTMSFKEGGVTKQGQSWLITGADFLDAHFYCAELGPLGRGNAIGALDNQTVVNGLREAKYTSDAVVDLCNFFGIAAAVRDRLKHIWVTEYGFQTAPYWASGQDIAKGEVRFNGVGGAVYTCKVAHRSDATNQMPNTTFWAGGVVNVFPGVKDSTYSHGETGTIIEENVAGIHYENTGKIMAGVTLDADNVNIKDKVGIFMWFQPLDEGPPYQLFHYGLLYRTMQPKGSPSTSGSYAKWQANAGRPRPAWFTFT